MKNWVNLIKQGILYYQAKYVFEKNAFEIVQDYIKQKYKDPYHWGAFILVGL